MLSQFRKMFNFDTSPNKLLCSPHRRCCVNENNNFHRILIRPYGAVSPQRGEAVCFCTFRQVLLTRRSLQPNQQFQFSSEGLSLLLACPSLSVGLFSLIDVRRTCRAHVVVGPRQWFLKWHPGGPAGSYRRAAEHWREDEE